MAKNPYIIRDTIYLDSDTVHSFGLSEVTKIKELSEGKEIAYAVQVDKVEEDKNKITVTLDIESKEVQVFYKKSDLNKMTSLFIGWAYLLVGEQDFKNRNVYKEKATEYLKIALKPVKDNEDDLVGEEEPSPLAYYLVSKYDIKISWLRSYRIELYRHFNKDKKLFSDFYRQLIFRENNQLRKIMIAQKALEYYPTDGFFVEIIANDIFFQKHYLDCINFIRERKKFFLSDDWTEMDTLRITLIRALMSEEKYEEALEELKTKIWAFGTDYTNLLKGAVYHQQKNYTESIKAFEHVVIEDYVNHDACVIASYYLLECYLLNGDSYKLSNLISSFVLGENQVYLFGHEPYKEEEIINMFERVLSSKELDERLLAKVKVMYAYVLQEGLQFGQTPVGPLTTDEKEILEKCLELVRSAIPFYKEHVFINGFYSNLLRAHGDNEKALDYRLRAIFNDKGESMYYVGAELKEAGQSYLSSYPSHLKKLLVESNGALENYTENLGFDFDLGALWNHKKYKQIQELYKFVEPHIQSNSRFGEISNHTDAGDWFHIAYALSEVEDIKGSIAIYEKILGEDAENSSVLNNLAIAYEKQGELGKAKNYIKTAKKLAPEDETIERNYSRLNSVKKTKEILSAKKEVEQPKSENSDPKAITEGSNGYLILGKEKILIGPSKNVPFKLVQALCPFGNAKAVSAVYGQTNTERSKLRDVSLSLSEKEVQLRHRVKELQEILRQKRIRVSLQFNSRDQTVFLEYHSRG